jgi:choline dehydrogenase-like flavoprotein
MSHNLQEDFTERFRVNQQELSSEPRTRFDYIVCGAGTSGCVVAARLAADPKTHVLLLEAGGTDETDLITNPNRWPMTLGSELDWGFVAEPNPHLNGRAIPYSMGKVLGGGSSINVSTWSRGHRADWDFYASESGDPSWGYEAVLDLYRQRIEAWVGSPDPDYRGAEWCTCNLQKSLTHSPSLCWKALNRWDCNGFQTRMATANGELEWNPSLQ